MTTRETQLIQKKFYETQIDDIQNVNKLLGDAYYKELQKDVPNLTYIRFAQGELYYSYKDFEAAIFKWESIQNELEPWAKKNIADAYFELSQYSIAENLYKSIQTDSLTLQTEISLQLFSLYIHDERTYEASAMIKDVVAANPSYPDVTNLARHFFEEKGDYLSAIDLAVTEAIRTEDMKWFNILQVYAETRKISLYDPSYYLDVLLTLTKLDQKLFEVLFSTMWENYEQDEQFLSWLEISNKVITFVVSNIKYDWNLVESKYLNTFEQVLEGELPLKEVQQFIPSLLGNWLRLKEKSHYPVAAAVIAWEELFPLSFTEDITAQAELLLTKRDISINEEINRLFHKIVVWAADQQIEVSHKLRWIMARLKDSEVRHILFMGTNTVEAPLWFSTMLQMNKADIPDSNVTLFSFAKEEQIDEINSIGTTSFVSWQDLSYGDTYVHYHGPIPALKTSNSSLIYTPPFRGTVKERSSLLVNLHLADEVIYCLHHANPLNEQESQLLTQMKKQIGNLRVHFLVSDNTSNMSSHELTMRLRDVFPDATVQTFSAASSLSFLTNTLTVEQVRKKNELFFIEETLQYLSAKKIDKEEKVSAAIQLNKEMLAKLSGASAQLSDVEAETIGRIKNPLLSILDELKIEVETQIPSLLQGTANLIKEDSDFGSLHEKLNEEMNDQIELYLQETVLPQLYLSLQKWVNASKDELDQIDGHLNEMAASFNALYGTEKFAFVCDPQLLHDWRRDTGRLTSGTQLERLNILLKFNPLQFLLKSAGKILGGLAQNKALLQNKYKQFVKNEDYHEVASQISKSFMAPFYLFAAALDRDLELYFSGPKSELTNAAGDMLVKIEELETSLKAMQADPNVFQNPIKLFEIQRRILQLSLTSDRNEKITLK